MKVLLLTDVRGTGKKGEIKEFKKEDNNISSEEEKTLKEISKFGKLRELMLFSK